MEQSITVTGENLKALTHPLRVRILGMLRTHGPATATMLAEQLGLTSGALSYHLRRLERYGFIVEDEARGNDRDRWWRAAHRLTFFDPLSLDPATAEAGETFERNIAAWLEARLVRALDERRDWPEEWRPALTASDVLLDLTADQARALENEILAVLERYPTHDPAAAQPAGTRCVGAAFQIVPITPAADRTP
ncbi:winged helix-turn-helix domain-containing protein [Propionicicella superfundia]|uniref:winged helix-turn-helix domain-containing protein n=1 Tax=Propionicicella superfundia TaxID=348582 RepID=UPI0003FD5553|nr:winged helix-turn-helix domain-containing protein [Propionicicella superfundia]